MNVMSRSDEDDPLMPRKVNVAILLRFVRLYAALCYAVSGSLIALSLALDEWHEPASWPIVLISTIGAPLFPYVVVVQAVFLVVFMISNPTFAALAAGFFVTSAFLLRHKNVGWWLIIVAFVPCATLAAFALHAIGWVPKPKGPL